MGMKNIIKRFIQDDRGQSTTEYILILAVVVLIAMKFRDRIAGESGILNKVLGNVERDISNFDSR
jgi:Flp pilus assembly pilin Flp